MNNPTSSYKVIDEANIRLAGHLDFPMDGRGLVSQNGQFLSNAERSDTKTVPDKHEMQI